MKIYVVSTGSYEDQAIAGVFTRRDWAETARGLLKDANEIDEYETDPIVERPPGMSLYEVVMRRDLQWVDINRPSRFDFIGCPESVKAGAKYFVVLVWAQDVQEARDIVDGWRQQLIADGKWPER